MKKTLLASAMLGLFASQGAFAANDTAELRNIIKGQQKVLQQLEKRLETTEKRIEKTADAVEDKAESDSATTIGGYGELHYNNIDGKDNKIDFHRFVLFVGHEFNETTRFFSELEIEHSLSGDGKPGEVELEQAYIEHDFSDTYAGKAGLFLVPVGIINETHEPETFYGVERNPVEKNIIPATWWEAGLALNIQAAPGLAFDAAVTSGLEVDSRVQVEDSDGSLVTNKKGFNIRSGRQKVAKATANDLAYTGRVKYTGVNGLELAATLQYQTDITQGDAATDTASATLFSAHAIYSIEDFTVKALYAQWDVDGKEAETLGRDEQMGYYIEPAYRFDENFGVFGRYNVYNNEAGSDAEDIKQYNVGVNYWLNEHVVFKADYEKQGGRNDSKGFNLGLGYSF